MQVWRKCVALLCQEACDVDFCGDPSPPTVGEAPSELLCPIGRSDLLLAFHTNALGIGCRLAANRGGDKYCFGWSYQGATADNYREAMARSWVWQDLADLWSRSRTSLQLEKWPSATWQALWHSEVVQGKTGRVLAVRG